MKSDFTLAQPFEASGKWWLPEKPDKVLAGTIKYSIDDIVLVLHGGLDDEPLERTFAMGGDFKRYSHVHGTIEGGKLCTLLNVIVTNRTHNLRESTGSQCSAIFLIVGGHTGPQADFRTSALSVRLTHLGEFLGRRLFRIDHAAATGNWTVTYEHPPQIVYRLPSHDVTLKINSAMNVSPGTESAALTAEAYIVIEPQAPQTLGWFLEAVWRICDLLTLMTDERVRPTALRLSLDSGANDGWLLYAVVRPPSDGASTSSPIVFLTLRDAQDGFGRMLDKWFSARGPMLKSTHLFRHARLERDSLNDRFLNATKSIEAFSRATAASLYMPPEDFAMVRAALVSAIPTHVDEALCKSIKKRLQFANEHSLRKRFKTLLRSLAASSVDVVCNSVARFADGVVDTRNYLTHYSDDSETVPLNEVDRHWAYEKMLMLLRILLLREMGLDEQLIVDRLKTHPRLSQRIALSKKYREVPALAQPDGPAPEPPNVVSG